MADETFSESLAQYVASLASTTLPAEIIESAKLHILDSLGCLLAGSRLGPGELAYELAVANSGTNSTLSLLGSDRRASFPDAVQAMSVAAHCGEMDEIGRAHV